MPNLAEQLANEIADVEWEVLIPHAKRDAVVVVCDDLNLLAVGIAIANDDALSVQNWIAEQSIHKPTLEQLTTWNSAQDKEFTTLIVQPYVLVQEKKG